MVMAERGLKADIVTTAWREGEAVKLETGVSGCVIVTVAMALTVAVGASRAGGGQLLYG